MNQVLGINGNLGSTANAVPRIGGRKTLNASSLTISNNNCLTIPGSEITANEPLLNLSQTWNNAGVTFSGIKLNITNTASAAASMLLDLQIGGTTKFFAKAGEFGNGPSQCTCTNVYNYGWNLVGGNTYLYSDAANTLALRNGVNAQAFSIYNTWGNSGTDYQRLRTYFSGTNAVIACENGGTGIAQSLLLSAGSGNNVLFGSSGTATWGVVAGVFQPWGTDGTADFGKTNARIRTGYFGTSLNVASGAITASTPLLVLSQTWNSAGTLFDGITFDVTDSGGASASSTLLRLRVGGSNMFRVYKGGSIESASTVISGASVGVGGGNAYLSAVSSHVLELRNGVNAQAFGVYNTYTSSTNYERLTQAWATNVCKIWTEKGSGGGTARDLVLGADSTELVRFQTGSKIGFFGVTPVSRPDAYTVTNGATDRAYDASATTVGELANVLNTLIADLRGLGLVA